MIFSTCEYLRGHLGVRLVTQHKSLCKYNLRLLANTCESVWLRIRIGSIYADLSTLFYASPLRGRTTDLSDANFDPFRTIGQRSGVPCIPREEQYHFPLHNHGRVFVCLLLLFCHQIDWNTDCVITESVICFLQPNRSGS